MHPTKTDNIMMSESGFGIDETPFYSRVIGEKVEHIVCKKIEEEKAEHHDDNHRLAKSRSIWGSWRDFGPILDHGWDAGGGHPPDLPNL